MATNARMIDLSVPIVASPPELPDVLRIDLEVQTHAQGAQAVEAMLGVPPRLLRDGEGWATETFTRFGTHNSTHVDAPWHYNSTIDGERAQAIDELPLEWLFAPGVVLDMTHKADGDPVTAAEVEAELARAGHELAPLDIVLVRTGRDAFLAEPDYMARGCGVTAEATHWLHERGVRVMGIDAWGWDAPLHLQDFALTPTFAGGSIRRLLPRLALRRGLNQKGLFTYAGRPKPAADAVKRAFRR